jgi:LPXTG-motif cell wall-anchored protein
MAAEDREFDFTNTSKQVVPSGLSDEGQNILPAWLFFAAGLVALGMLGVVFWRKRTGIRQGV